MRRTALFLLSILLLPLASLAQSSPQREAAQEMLTMYRFQRAEGMLQAEERCWMEAKAGKKDRRAAALGCARLLISGGLIDAAMQISEARGPVPAFTPQVQRQRYLARATGLGLTQEQAQSVLEVAVGEMPQLVEGLSLAGLR